MKKVFLILSFLVLPVALSSTPEVGRSDAWYKCKDFDSVKKAIESDSFFKSLGIPVSDYINFFNNLISSRLKSPDETLGGFIAKAYQDRIKQQKPSDALTFLESSPIGTGVGLYNDGYYTEYYLKDSKELLRNDVFYKEKTRRPKGIKVLLGLAGYKDRRTLLNKIKKPLLIGAALGGIGMAYYNRKAIGDKWNETKFSKTVVGNYIGKVSNYARYTIDKGIRVIQRGYDRAKRIGKSREVVLDPMNYSRRTMFDSNETLDLERSVYRERLLLPVTLLGEYLDADWNSRFYEDDILYKITHGISSLQGNNEFSHLSHARELLYVVYDREMNKINQSSMLNAKEKVRRRGLLDNRYKTVFNDIDRASSYLNSWNLTQNTYWKPGMRNDDPVKHKHTIKRKIMTTKEGLDVYVEGANKEIVDNNKYLYKYERKLLREQYKDPFR